MGVLEDAIREHLDLRRRHGAAEDELRDQEAEALGPARREDEAPEPAPADPGGTPPDPADEPTRLAEIPTRDEPEGSGLPFDGAATGDTAFDEDDEPPPEPVLEDEPFVTEEPVMPEDRVPDEPVTEVGSPSDEPFGDEELPPEEQPTEHHPPPPQHEGEAEDEDVLEETPDFLSETPEHDRLWFEQKPPRDFDFD